MKSLKYIIIFISAFFIFSLNAFAKDSAFEPTINIEFVEDEANIILGFKGEELNDITSTIAYDSRYFEFMGLSQMEDFRIRDQKESSDGRWKILTVSLVSDNFYLDTNYALVTLKLKSNLKKGNVYFYDYLGISAADTYRYRHNGFNDTIRNRDGAYEYTQKLNTKQTKIMYRIFEWLPYVLVIIGALLILFIIYLIIPSKRVKEDRKSKINEKIYTANNVIIGERKHAEVVEETEELKDYNRPEEPKIQPQQNIIQSDNEEGLIRLSTVDFGDEDEENNNN